MDVQEAGQWEVRGGADVGGREYMRSECVPGTDRGMAGRGGQGGVGAVYRVGGRGLKLAELEDGFVLKGFMASW